MILLYARSPVYSAYCYWKQSSHYGFAVEAEMARQDCHGRLELPVVSQPFGVKMYKTKTLLLQIADNFIEMPVGGGTSIVEYQ
jgi:hypothetical protein